MIKILTIIGARPQIIKAAALSRAIKNSFSSKIEEKILHTGQHYDENIEHSEQVYQLSIQLFKQLKVELSIAKNAILMV